MVIHALYGLKSTALKFRNHLAEKLRNKIGFKSSLANPDLWYKASTPPDVFDYYLYILVYMDDILIIDKFTQRYTEMVKTSFTVKSSRIEEPKSYLGADVVELYYEYCSYAWTMGSKAYLEKAIKNLNKKLDTDGFIFNKKLPDVNYSPKRTF